MRPIVVLIAIVVAGLLIGAVAIGIYKFTSTPSLMTSSADLNSLSPSTSYTTSGTTNDTISQSTSSESAPPCGYQQTVVGLGVQPFGCWADNLGFLPAGYVVAPHLTNGAVYPCPPGMSTAQCRTFQQTCGNGFCDPNESCSDCPIDCMPPNGQTCNPYTGRVGSVPTAVCQVDLNATTSMSMSSTSSTSLMTYP
jgi:hypothetical protein